jgi:hypothetical protein
MARDSLCAGVKVDEMKSDKIDLLNPAALRMLVMRTYQT